MADQRYDVSPEQKEILLERAKRRTFLRNEFQKQLYDPHRHASMEGGHVVSLGEHQRLVLEVMLRYETKICRILPFLFSSTEKDFSFSEFVAFNINIFYFETLISNIKIIICIKIIEIFIKQKKNLKSCMEFRGIAYFFGHECCGLH